MINWLVVVLLVGSTRAMARWWLRGSFRRISSKTPVSRVAVYGAGDAGVQIAMALSENPLFKPMAFIDDSRALQGRHIEGLRVHPFRDLARLIENETINEVIMAMPSVSRSRRSEIISMLEPYSIRVTTLPGLDDMATGRIKIDDIHEVGVDDFLQVINTVKIDVS